MKEPKIVTYTKELGEFTLPQGCEELLHGLSIEAQMDLFRISTQGNRRLLTDSVDVLSLIVYNEMIVGVVLSDAYCRPTPCYINDVICTWDSEDNNGAGYKTRTEYTRLVFLPLEDTEL